MFEHVRSRHQMFKDSIREGDRVARRWLIIYIGIAVFLVIVAAALFWMNRGYKTFEVVDVIDKNDDVSVHYQVIGDGLIRYSKDGASFTDKYGNVAWNQSFEMSNAQVASCGDYLAIGDIGSNQIRIFNQAGQIAVIDALYPVAAVEIANQGVTAAILSDGQQHYIDLYDSAGVNLVRIKATMTNTGYPIDIALSEDGTKLAVSYLVIGMQDVTTKLVFYHFGDMAAEDEESEAAVTATYEYAQIFPKITFINNNTMVAFGEAGFEIFSVKDNKPEVVLEKLFDNDIKSIFYNEQYVGFVFRNDGSDQAESETQLQTGELEAVTHILTTSAVDSSDTGTSSENETTSGSASVPDGSPHESSADVETNNGNYPSLNQSISETAAGSGISTDGSHRYKLLVYTNTGNLYLDTEFDFDYHYIDCTNDEIIMYNDTECYLMYYTGQEKFTYTFEDGITSLMPKQSKNEYIIIDDNSIKEIKLK